MTTRRWIVTTVTVVLLLVSVDVAVLATMDVYGILRNPRGRSLPVYYADRMGKFLLNSSYVPANFDALLIGPSSSVNWEPEVVTQGTGLRMYNESLEGGNASEEKLLVDQALVKGHFRLAIVLLYPTMITSHEYHDGIDKVRWTEALGSLDSYLQVLLSEMTSHRIILTSKQHASGDGSHEMRNPNAVLAAQAIDFTVDPAGVNNLKALVNELRNHGVKLVYVVPTVYEAVLECNQAPFSHFIASMQAILPPAPLIDLTTPEYKDFRSNPSNYIDVFHVTPEGAWGISTILNARFRKLPTN
jgi:hypothetical protein